MSVRLTRGAVVLCTFGLVAAGAGLLTRRGEGGEGPIPPKPAADERAIRALAEERLATARAVCEQDLEMFKNGRRSLSPDMAQWSLRWMEDQINLEGGAADRLTAIKAHLDRMIFLEAVAESRKEAAQGTLGEVLKVRYYRLEAQQKLIEAGGAHLVPKAPPRAP